MQHDHVLKKLNYDLLTPSTGSGGGVYRQNIWYRVTAIVILLNVTCNITMFRKSGFLPIEPIHQGQVGVGWERGVCRQNICYHVSIFRDSV